MSSASDGPSRAEQLDLMLKYAGQREQELVDLVNNMREANHQLVESEAQLKQQVEGLRAMLDDALRLLNVQTANAAKVAALEALADRFDQESEEQAENGYGSDLDYAADQIRKVLNGSAR